MTKKYTFLTSLFLIFSFGFAQKSELKGKVMSSIKDLEGITVTNLRSNYSTLTESGGYFTIRVLVNDTLQFSAVQFKDRKVVVRASDLQSDVFYVNLELISYDLKEVVVDQHKGINAVSMGILAVPAKKYSPAERKLHEATTGGGIVPLNPILNAISGRTSMLKKEIEVEKKEYTIRKLNEWFEANFYTERFKIPTAYIEGFQYFLADDPQFESAVRSKNKTLTVFLMGEVAVTYLNSIQE
jgi:hypothetical protein